MKTKTIVFLPLMIMGIISGVFVMITPNSTFIDWISMNSLYVLIWIPTVLLMTGSGSLAEQNTSIVKRRRWCNSTPNLHKKRMKWLREIKFEVGRWKMIVRLVVIKRLNPKQPH